MSADEELLLEHAAAARAKAHAPYSHFYVGAALIDEQGNIHAGCNTENASFPLGACAEANAIGAMVLSGGTRIVRIAVIGGRDEPEVCLPCGGCRQRIAEFAGEETEVIIRDDNNQVRRYTVDDLLPLSFKLQYAE